MQSHRTPFNVTGHINEKGPALFNMQQSLYKEIAIIVEKAAVGKGRGRRNGKARVVDQTAGMAE
jgi:hypothetical protein